MLPLTGIIMTKKTDTTLSGRAVPNDQGNVTWEWQTDATVDTIVVHSLGKGLSLDSGGNPQSTGTNPYDQSAVEPSVKEGPRRRTLDDMRLLSEAIKRSKDSPQK